LCLRERDKRRGAFGSSKGREVTMVSCDGNSKPKQ
jgi:hypothetical protein